MAIDKLTQVKDYIDNILSFSKNENDNDKVSETFSISSKELISDNVRSVIEKTEILPERMSQEEKMDIVRELNEKSAFLIKGVITEATSSLKVSEATAYRYLSKIKKK